MSTAGIHYRLGLDAGPLAKGFAMAQAAVSKFASGAASAMRGVGTTLAGIGTVGSAAFAKGLFSAADMESVTTAFETLLGSTSKAGQVLGDLKKFAADTPFEFPELADAGKKLLAMEGSADSLVGELRMLGDIASGVGMPIGELADLFAKARTKERLFMDDMNQLGGRGIPILTMLAKQFKTSTGEVRGLVEQGKVGFPEVERALRGMTAEGGKFFEMMQRQAQTAKGLWSTLSDSIGEVSRAFNEPFLAELKPGLDDAIKGTNGLADAAASVGQNMADGIGLFRQMIKLGTFDMETASRAMYQARVDAMRPIERPPEVAEAAKGMNPEGGTKAERKQSNADALARIGLYVGGGGPSAERYARETAQSTKQATGLLGEINRKMDRDKGGTF